MNEQMNLFDFMATLEERTDEPSPFQPGTYLWYVKLDRVTHYEVERYFRHGHPEEAPYGYDVHKVNDIRSRSTLQHRELGTSVFTTEAEAVKKAEENSVGIMKYSAQKLQELTLNIRSFEQTKHSKKTIALLPMGGYIKEYYSYPFLHCYPDLKSATAAFERMCNKTLSAEPYKGKKYIEISDHYSFEDMYRCSDEKYSALEYAYNHGAPYGDAKRFSYGNIVDS